MTNNNNNNSGTTKNQAKAILNLAYCLAIEDESSIETIQSEISKSVDNAPRHHVYDPSNKFKSKPVQQSIALILHLSPVWLKGSTEKRIIKMVKQYKNVQVLKAKVAMALAEDMEAHEN